MPRKIKAYKSPPPRTRATMGQAYTKKGPGRTHKTSFSPRMAFLKIARGAGIEKPRAKLFQFPWAKNKGKMSEFSKE